MKDNCKSVCLDSGIDIEKVHGHMDLVLTNVKTGKVEEVHEDNLITNAIRDYFANCGFLNYPSIDKSQLVELLMGGVMLFDDNISENADIVFAPAGLHMTANAAQGYTNNVPNTEQGTATANDGSTVYNGWQPDGSYLHTYEWNTMQGNSNKGIACVCLANKEYAWAGEGNCESGSRHSTRASITSIEGGATSISGITGTVFNINLSDSSCYSFNIETRTDSEEQEYTTGVLRKYRLPISKLNVKGTMSAPVKLSEQEVALESDMTSEDERFFLMYENCGTTLKIWNAQMGHSAPAVWGDGWNQYIWTLTSSGTLTKQTIYNTTGDTLYGIQAAHFDGNYCFFVNAWGYWGYYTTGYASSLAVYKLNLSNGVITKINNPYGSEYRTSSTTSNWTSWYPYLNWVRLRGNGDGRLLTGGASGCFITDSANNECYPTNAANAYYSSYYPTSSPLIKAVDANLYRDQSYIASINNLANTVYKNSEKTMKLTYRITFDEE